MDWLGGATLVMLGVFWAAAIVLAKDSRRDWYDPRP
jgi:hypothetical protein